MIHRPHINVVRAFALWAACTVSLLAVTVTPARAALEIDPAALSRTMNNAYQQGAAAGWHFADEVAYFSTVLAAGRAYDLRRPNDPATAALGRTAVRLALRLRYDALTNHDAAEWYLRQAAAALVADPELGAQATAFLARLDAERADVARLARDGMLDAAANAAAYPGDAEAQSESVSTALAAYALTHDTGYRSRALASAAQPTFPIGAIDPDLAAKLGEIAHAAESGAEGYTDADRVAARALRSHQAHAQGIPVIGRVLSHEAQLSLTAPADEYFGDMRMSPLGVRNEIIRIGRYLDSGWGDRMNGEALQLVSALVDWQHNYPRDYELPTRLLEAYHLLGRLSTPQCRVAADEIRRLLTVEYPSTPQAQTLLSS